MSSPQFQRQSTRPLRPDSIRAATRRFRQLCDIIERHADPKDQREKAQLTRAIHGLALASRSLRNRATAKASREIARDGINPSAGMGESGER